MSLVVSYNIVENLNIHRQQTYIHIHNKITTDDKYIIFNYIKEVKCVWTCTTHIGEKDLKREDEI